MYFHDSVIALPQTAVTPLSCPGREIERKGADGVKEGARESKRTILKAILRNKVCEFCKRMTQSEVIEKILKILCHFSRPIKNLELMKNDLEEIKFELRQSLNLKLLKNCDIYIYLS